MSIPRIRQFLMLLGVAALLALPAPAAHAQTASATVPVGAELKFHPLYFRSTVAASSVVIDRNWAKVPPGQSTLSNGVYADSTVFRKASATITSRFDTSAALRVEQLNFQPTFGPTLSNAVADTSSVPWLVLRCVQDTTQYSYTSNSVLDSVRFAAEYSYDGTNWFSCPGTNTRRFDTVFLTTGADGLQNPTVVGVEASPGEDAAQVVLSCHPSQATTNSVILNRTLCMQGGTWVRFILGGDYVGQFRAEYGTWEPAN